MNIQHKKSFTLLEVMIFVMILSVVLVTSTSFITRLLFNLKRNEHRTMATFLGDDVKEWLNGERESNTWNNFHQKAGTTVTTFPGNRYCINQPLNLDHTINSLGVLPAPFNPGDCPGFVSIQTGLPAIYKRELDLFKNDATDPSQVTATITVSWLEIGGTSISQVKTIYTSEF